MQAIAAIAAKAQAAKPPEAAAKSGEKPTDYNVPPGQRGVPRLAEGKPGTTGIEVAEHAFRQSVHKADIGAGICLPGLADNALHRSLNPLRGGSAIVDRKLDKEQIRLVIQHVLLQAEYAEVRAGSTNGSVDFD
jgi:hypothetical protein